MNPDNKLPERTYFIGGSPRVGKSILAYALAKKVDGHVVSTDAIRNAAKKASKDKGSDLFIINKNESLPTQDWLKMHLEEPKEVVEVQNRESRAVWPSIISFIDSFVEDDAVHIVEGVAILPSLVASMKVKPQHILFVGNTSSNHVKALLKHGQEYPERDWMAAMGYGREKVEAMASFITEMSRYFKREAEKHGLSYYEISDDNFNKSIGQIVQQVLGR